MTGLKSGGEIEGGAREWRIIYPGARACNGGGGILGGKNERLKKTKRRGKGVKLKKGGGRFTGKCGGAHLCRKKTLFSSSLFFFRKRVSFSLFSASPEISKRRLLVAYADSEEEEENSGGVGERKKVWDSTKKSRHDIT